MSKLQVAFRHPGCISVLLKEIAYTLKDLFIARYYTMLYSIVELIKIEYTMLYRVRSFRSDGDIRKGGGKMTIMKNVSCIFFSSS